MQSVRGRARGSAGSPAQEELPHLHARRPVVLQPPEIAGDGGATESEETAPSRSHLHLLASTLGRAVHLQSDLIGAQWSSQMLSETHGLGQQQQTGQAPVSGSAIQAHAKPTSARRQHQPTDASASGSRVQQQQHHPQQHPLGKGAEGPAVRSDVLAMLIKVAEELNQAQAEFEYRKQMLSSSNPALINSSSFSRLAPLEEEAADEMRQGLLPPRIGRMLSYDMAAMRKVYEDKEARGSRPPSRVMPAALPAVLAKTKEEQRWGFFACGNPKLWVPPPPSTRTAGGHGTEDARESEGVRLDAPQAAWQRTMLQRRRSVSGSGAAPSPPPGGDEAAALDAVHEEQQQQQGDEACSGPTLEDQNAAACTIQRRWRQYRARRAALLADQGVREPLSDEEEQEEGSRSGSSADSSSSGCSSSSSDTEKEEGRESGGKAKRKTKGGKVAGKRSKASGEHSKGKSAAGVDPAGAKQKSGKASHSKAKGKAGVPGSNAASGVAGKAGKKDRRKSKGAAAQVHVVDVVGEAEQGRDQVIRGGTVTMQRSARASMAGGSDAAETSRRVSYASSAPSPLPTELSEGRLRTGSGAQLPSRSGAGVSAGGQGVTAAGLGSADRSGAGPGLQGQGESGEQGPDEQRSDSEDDFEGEAVGTVDFPAAPARPSSPGQGRAMGQSPRPGSRTCDSDGSRGSTGRSSLSSSTGQQARAGTGAPGAEDGGEEAGQGGVPGIDHAEAVLREGSRAFPLGHERISALLAAAAVLERDALTGEGHGRNAPIDIFPLEEGDLALIDSLAAAGPGQNGLAAGAATPHEGSGAAGAEGEPGISASPGPFEVMYALSRLSVPPPSSPRGRTKAAQQGSARGSKGRPGPGGLRGGADAVDGIPLELGPARMRQPHPPRQSHLTEIMETWATARRHCKPDDHLTFTLTGKGSDGLPIPRAPSSIRQSSTHSPHRTRRGAVTWRPHAKSAALRRPVPEYVDRSELLADVMQNGTGKARGRRHSVLGLVLPMVPVEGQDSGRSVEAGGGEQAGAGAEVQAAAEAVEASGATTQASVTVSEAVAAEAAPTEAVEQEANLAEGEESWQLTHVDVPLRPSQLGAGNLDSPSSRNSGNSAELSPLPKDWQDQQGSESLRAKLQGLVLTEAFTSHGHALNPPASPSLPRVSSPAAPVSGCQSPLKGSNSSSVEPLPRLSSPRAAVAGSGSSAFSERANPVAAAVARAVVDRAWRRPQPSLQVDVDPSAAAAQGATSPQAWLASMPLPDLSPKHGRSLTGPLLSPAKDPLSPVRHSPRTVMAISGTSPGRWGSPLRSKTARLARAETEASDGLSVKLPPAQRSVPTSPGPSSPSQRRSASSRVTLPRLVSPQRQRMAGTFGHSTGPQPSDLSRPRHVMYSVDVWAEHCLQATVTRSMDMPVPETSLSWAVHTLLRSGRQGEAAEEEEAEEPTSPARR